MRLEPILGGFFWVSGKSGEDFGGLRPVLFKVLAAFTMVVFSFLSVRRSVRSTSAASRRDAERAKLKVQVA